MKTIVLFLIMSVSSIVTFSQSIELLPNQAINKAGNGTIIESEQNFGTTLRLTQISSAYADPVSIRLSSRLPQSNINGIISHARIESSLSGLEIHHIYGQNAKFSLGIATGTKLMITNDSVITRVNSRINGFTKLGSDAPAIKIKKLTSGCTTSANSGFPSGEISLTHGVTPSKILKVEALVEYATNFWAKDGNDLFGYQFDVYITNTTISLRNLSGSASSEIRSKPCKILITYEE